MEVKHISKVIHHQTILADIEFEVIPGNIVGIVGRNGAGKTTLLRSMAGILKPTKGDITIDGQSIFLKPSLKAQTIFVPDSSEALKNYSTKELIYLYKSIYPHFDQQYLEALMNRFSLEPINKIGNYSKGMKALFTLIVAFATKAKYILLDEPTDGLDVIIKKQILQILIEEVADKDVAVIISSHRLDELEFMANDVILIKDGRVDSHYELDSMKELYKKIQLVFETELPEEIAENTYVLEQTGRVSTVLIPRDSTAVEELISSYHPLLYEELSMSLEDYFIAKLGGDDNV
ncbi:ABC transporter ATP-binding protein [Alkalicoccus daliensis]|uniref:ABC-2 type transport system ATP-binding protein n=1 Tax=Alkalicoccus daliensis TaxID=745820 RepID=A0A1H0ID76_9BACI|nr:ABC transporter ATP-binding protein [Alkalicoccus daliensis]SDO29031.1 ABC-2 type transport system ATP-binding protein [Alkalicoccus daliensis]